MNTFRLMLALAGAGVWFSSGCSSVGFDADDWKDESASEPVALQQAALAATGDASTYSAQCTARGVPLPPNFGSATIGTGAGKWQFKGNFSSGFTTTGIGVDVYFSTSSSPAGICVIAPHYDGVFSVLCQGATGYACFWEKTGLSPLPPAAPAAPVVIAGSSSFPGGTALASQCTVCHAGQNAFITHNKPGHPLNGAGVTGWMTSTWYEPIVPAGWTSNPGPASVGYPAQCTNCHNNTAGAGSLPTLATSRFKGGGGAAYCTILRKITNMPASEGGMPAVVNPSYPCTSADATNCPGHPTNGDPEILAMLNACGVTISPMTSPVGVSAFGSSTTFAGSYDHIFVGTKVDTADKVYRFSNAYASGAYAGFTQSDLTSSLNTPWRPTMWAKDGDGSKLALAVTNASGIIWERESGATTVTRQVNTSTNPAAGSPYAYIRLDGKNAILYRGRDNRIYEALWNAGSWTVSLLPWPASTFAEGDPIGYKRGTTESVVYKCGPSTICEVRRILNAWHTRTIPTASPIRPNTIPMPFKRAWSSDYYIFYSAENGLRMILDPQEPALGFSYSDWLISTYVPTSSPAPYDPQDSGVRVAFIQDLGGTQASRLLEAVLPYASTTWETQLRVSSEKWKENLVGDPWAFIGSAWRNTIVFRNSVNTLYHLQTVNSSMGNVAFTKTTIHQGFNLTTLTSVTQNQEIRWSRKLPTGKYKYDIQPTGGNPNLYVKLDSAPTTSSYDCRPNLSGTNAESCTVTISNSGGGTIHVMVRGAASGTSGFTINGYHIE